MKIGNIVKKFAKPATAIIGGIALLGMGVMNVLSSSDDTVEATDGEIVDDYVNYEDDTTSDTESTDEPE